MRAYGGVEEEPHSFLIPALPEVDWPVSFPGCFTTGEEPLCTHWIGGWVDPRGGVDDEENRKIYSPIRNRKTSPRLPAHGLVTSYRLRHPRCEPTALKRSKYRFHHSFGCTVLPCFFQQMSAVFNDITCQFWVLSWVLYCVPSWKLRTGCINLQTVSLLNPTPFTVCWITNFAVSKPKPMLSKQQRYFQDHFLLIPYTDV